MYQFYLRIGKINEKGNTIFISPVTLTSYFDVTLNKRNAGQGSVFCVWLLSCKDSMSLVVRKRFLLKDVLYENARPWFCTVPLRRSGNVVTRTGTSYYLLTVIHL